MKFSDSFLSFFMAACAIAALLTILGILADRVGPQKEVMRDGKWVKQRDVEPIKPIEPVEE